MCWMCDTLHRQCHEELSRAEVAKRLEDHNRQLEWLNERAKVVKRMEESIEAGESRRKRRQPTRRVKVGKERRMEVAKKGFWYMLDTYKTKFGCDPGARGHKAAPLNPPQLVKCQLPPLAHATAQCHAAMTQHASEPSSPQAAQASARNTVCQCASNLESLRDSL